MENYEYDRYDGPRLGAKNKLLRGLALIAGMAAIAMTGSVIAEDSQKEKTPINCYVSPPAEEGDTEFGLARTAYHELDKIDPANVDIVVIPGNIEGTGEDHVLNVGDTVRVCIND